MGVFVIDDDPGIRELLAEVLLDEGYDVMSAANGQEAVAYLRASPHHPCLILLDLMMPVMNGWEFREAQLQDPSIAPIPVVVLSAVSDLAAAAANLQASGHLVKPVELDQLLATVEYYCKA